MSIHDYDVDPEDILYDAVRFFFVPRGEMWTVVEVYPVRGGGNWVIGWPGTNSFDEVESLPVEWVEIQPPTKGAA